MKRISDSPLQYDITATARYTVVFEFNYFDCRFLVNTICAGSQSGIIPREVYDAGASDWRNHCGSGPFILTDFTAGAACTYVRNPNYWRTTTINGVEYETPFIDTLVMPIIPDESTKLAALRTGKLDAWQNSSTIRGYLNQHMS
jgi:peptide/nickel transport system substrate-binding protein